MENINIKECIEESEKLIFQEQSKYQRIMNTPTINHIELYNQMKGSWNSYLGVVGSFGPSLDAILRGAKSIVAFDINPLNILHSYLLIAAILKLEYPDFLKFISYSKEKSYYSNHFLKMIKEELPPDIKWYWEYIIKKYSNHPSFLRIFFNCYMFDEEIFPFILEKILEQNAYLKKEGYERLKKELKRVKIKFLLESFEKIPRRITDQKFDKIYLSCLNIYSYNHSEYFDNIKEYNHLLNPNGVMECAYIYKSFLEDDIIFIDPDLLKIPIKRIKIKDTNNLDSYELAYLYEKEEK